MKKSARKDKAEAQQSQRSPVSEQKVQSKLILKNLLLDHPIKGLHISIKAWKCKNLTIDTNKISDDVETFAKGRKYNEDQKSVLWTRLERCLSKSNKYFKRIEISHYHRKDVRRQFWHKIYRRYHVKEIIKSDAEDIPAKYFFRQDLSNLTAPITPNLALAIGRLHNLKTFYYIFVHLQSCPEYVDRAQKNIENILGSLRRFEWLSKIPIGRIPQKIFHIQELKVKADCYGENILEIFNALCRRKMFRKLESLDIQFVRQNEEMDLGFLNYLDLKHFGFRSYQQVKNLDALKSQDRLTSLALELKQPEHKELITALSSLKFLQKIYIQSNSNSAMPNEAAQLINSLDHLNYVHFYLESNKKNISFYENLKINVPRLSMKIFLSKKPELNELEACGKFLNIQSNLESLSFQVTQVRPETLKILKVALPKMAKLKDLRLEFNGHNGLSDKDYPSFTEIFPMLVNIDYLDLNFMGKAIVTKEIKGMFDNFSKIKQMKVFKFTTNFLSVDTKGMQEVIDFIKTRERDQFREIYIYPDAYNKSTFELMNALSRFQGLSIN